MSNTISINRFSQGNKSIWDSDRGCLIPDSDRYFGQPRTDWVSACIFDNREIHDEQYYRNPLFVDPYTSGWLVPKNDVRTKYFKEAIREILDTQVSPNDIRLVLDIRIPRPLWSVADAIESSKWMIDLEEDWDGDGSVAYSKVTWERAVRFLATNALSLWKECQIAVDTPAVHNGPNGSIDIYWNTPMVRLLINVPPEIHGDASFYGKNIEGKEIKGTLSLESSNHWLFLWQTGKQYI